VQLHDHIGRIKTQELLSGSVTATLSGCYNGRADLSLWALQQRVEGYTDAMRKKIPGGHVARRPSRTPNSEKRKTEDDARRHQVYVDWIRNALEKHDTTQVALARHLGVSKSVVNRILKGLRQLKAREIPVVASLLGPPPGLSGVEVSELPTYAEVRVLGRIAMNQWSHGPAEIEGESTIIGTTRRYAAQEQTAYEMSKAATELAPQMGTHVFTVAASQHRPRPMPGDWFVIRQHKDGANRDHLFRAELRGRGMVLVGLDKTEVHEPFPADMRWVIASHKEFY
jgi:transcriptional regulator with XRE-family HTH domain